MNHLGSCPRPVSAELAIVGLTILIGVGGLAAALVWRFGFDIGFLTTWTHPSSFSFSFSFSFSISFSFSVSTSSAQVRAAVDPGWRVGFKSGSVFTGWSVRVVTGVTSRLARGRRRMMAPGGSQDETIGPEVFHGC